MRTYIVFAGGYGRTRQLIGRPILKGEKPGSETVSADCIIAIDGLSVDEFFPPVELKQHNTWWCKVCGRVIPEYEMEKRIDCYLHEKEIRTKNFRKIWPSAYEEYTMVRRKSLKPMYRIWVGNTEGAEKVQQLWRFVLDNYPYNKPVPMPAPMTRNRRDLQIDGPEDVPVIKIGSEDSDSEENDSNPLDCDICGARFHDKRALRMHKLGKHKKETVA